MNQDKLIASDLGTRGQEAYEAGNVEEAMHLWTEAQVLYALLGHFKEAALCKVRIGIAHIALGNADRAIRFYQEAQEVFLNLALDPERADCETNIGVVLGRLGMPERAKEYFERAREIYFYLGLEKDVADCDLNIGAALSTMREWESSIEHIERAYRTFLEIGYYEEAATCDVNICLSLIKIGEDQQAIEHIKQAKKVYTSLGLKKDITECNLYMGMALIGLGEIHRGIKLIETARAVFLEFGFGTEVAICDAQIGLALAFHVTGTDLDKARIKNQQALIYLDSAISTIEQNRTRIFYIPYQISFVEHYIHYYEAALVCSLRLGCISDALLYLERSRSKSLAESIGIREKGVRVNYLKDVTEYLGLLPDDRSCLLDFLTWGEDRRLRIFCVTKQYGLELLIFPEGSLDQLDEVWNQWIGMYETSKNPKELANIVWETCHKLHEVIFNSEVEIEREDAGGAGPLKVGRQSLLDHLDQTLRPGDREQSRRLYLIPHDYLFLFPLHAACWDDRPSQVEAETTREERQPQPRPHYLLADYVVIYTPSAYLLKISQERHYQKPTQPHAMIVGNPQPLTDLPPLAGATVEARAVAEQLKQAGWRVDVLVENDATKQRFLNGDESRVAGINKGIYYHIHLAQHAGFTERRPLDNLYFGCPLDNITPEQYLWTGREIAMAPLQGTRSVVVASCWSSYTYSSSSEYLGMGAAFLKAGVGTFIGALYALSDVGSNRLVPELYRLHLEKGLSWAAALRQAQLQMAESIISDTDRERQEALIPDDHPLHWAAFTLIGKE